MWRWNRQKSILKALAFPWGMLLAKIRFNWPVAAQAVLVPPTSLAVWGYERWGTLLYCSLPVICKDTQIGIGAGWLPRPSKQVHLHQLMDFLSLQRKWLSKNSGMMIEADVTSSSLLRTCAMIQNQGINSTWKGAFYMSI